jgi:mono/diheme cytochrome c family protein
VIHRVVRGTVCLTALLLMGQGCRKSESLQFASSQKASQLSEKLQSAAKSELAKYTGGYHKPVLLVERSEPQPELARGQAVYQEQCVQCHGVSGDGQGLAAEFMYPRPRDYRKGLFKFTSTSYGSRPQREDLVRTVRQGVSGTSMPKFNLLPEKDLQAVVDYVITLSRRGELEEQLVETAQAEDDLDAELVKDELVPTVLNRWAEAESGEINPLTPQPKFTVAHIERGKKAFLTKGCSKCHGDDGRGQTLENKGTDIWGNQTRAADLTSGMLHGGQRPIDLYRRIFSGINGTPMPSFRHALQAEPDTIWDLVSYVLSVSRLRGRSIRTSVKQPNPLPLRRSDRSSPTLQGIRDDVRR